MAFTPFMQGSQAQGIINDYLDGKLNTTPNVNSAGNFRNPLYDIRTEQENAGVLDPSAQFPNPQLDFSAPTDAPVDPCPPGFMLVDGVCQPIEQFGQSAYDEQRNDRPDDPPREYYSIDEMKKMDDYEFLNYLTGAGNYMKGKDGQYTLTDPMNMGLFTMGLDKLFGNSRQLRNDFMREKLNELGYNFTNNKQGEPVYNLTTPMNIINNALASNKGGNRLATNQLSIFTPDEINYQIDQANSPNQGNYQAPTMTEQQVIEDAKKSGGSVNQFEAQNINAYTPSPQAPFSVDYENVYGADI